MPITQTLIEESEDTDIKSLAAKVLGAAHSSASARRLAAYVLGDADPERTTAHQLRQGEIDIPGNR